MAGTQASVAGHLDQQVGLVDPVVQHAGVAHGAVAVLGQGGGDLEGDEAVLAVALVVGRAQQPQRVLDVGDGQLPVGALHGVVLHQGLELLVVGVLAADGLGQDGRVRGDAPHALGDQLGQLPVFEPVAPEVVQPGALAADVVEIVESGHCVSSAPCAGYVVVRLASRAWARSTTFSTVNPNFSMFTAPGAEAPKRSSPIEASA